MTTNRRGFFVTCAAAVLWLFFRPSQEIEKETTEFVGRTTSHITCGCYGEVVVMYPPSLKGSRMKVYCRFMSVGAGKVVAAKKVVATWIIRSAEA